MDRHLALAHESQENLPLDALTAPSAARWLADYRGEPLVIENIVKNVFDRVRDDGVALMRFGVNLSDYHPAVVGRSYVWEQGAGLEITDRAYTPDAAMSISTAPSASFRRAPMVCAAV